MSRTQLKDLYAWELKLLWSASDQMHALVIAVAAQAHDGRLAEHLRESAADIERNTSRMQQLLSFAGSDDEPPHNSGMAAIVVEATRRLQPADAKSPELVDLEIMAHFLRLSNYSQADHGTAAAYAAALGRRNDQVVLQKIVSEVYGTQTLRGEIKDQAETAAAIEGSVSDDKRSP